MSIRDQNMLLNLLETEMLTSKKTREMKLRGIKLFATSNDIDGLSKPLKSRLIELHLPEYDFEEFRITVTRLAITKYGLSEEVGEKIAHVVWNDMKTRDVRDALKLSKLVTSIDDVDLLARTIMKYKRRYYHELNHYS
jgi:hypothetical protein